MKAHRRSVCGLTLVELLVALVVVSLIAAATAGLAQAIGQLASAASDVSGTADEAKMVLGFVEGLVREAHGSHAFPGLAVFADEPTGQYPDTLVVWSPEDEPADPSGLPLFSEIVVVTPHPDDAGRLLVLEDRTDQRPVPPLSDIDAWQAALDAWRRTLADSATVLTTRLHVPGWDANGAGGAAPLADYRPALRFYVESRPSPDEWDAYRAEQAAWDELRWPLGLVDRERGTARTRCRIEIQLRTDGGAGAGGEPRSTPVLVFAGSEAASFVVEKNDVATGN